MSVPLVKNNLTIKMFFICSDTAQFDYVFAENGLVAFKNGAVLKKQVC